MADYQQSCASVLRKSVLRKEPLVLERERRSLQNSYANLVIHPSCLPKCVTALFIFSSRTPSCSVFFRFPSPRPLLYHRLFTACTSVLQHLGGHTPFPSMSLPAWPMARAAGAPFLPVGYPVQLHAQPTIWKSSIFPWGWRWQCKPVPVLFT